MDDTSGNPSDGRFPITGTGRDALAEALEDVFGSIKRSMYLAWIIDDEGLHLRTSDSSSQPEPGWQKLFFLSGPGAFATRAMRWLSKSRRVLDDIGWKVVQETAAASGEVTGVLITPWQ